MTSGEPIVRTVGQLPTLPGTVSAGGLVWTSGLVSPTAFAGLASGTEVPPRQQVEETLELLRSVLADADVGLDRVVRVEAFLSSTDLLPVWNELYVEVWPEPGPARITLVAGFVSPLIHFELQVTAVR